MLSLVCGPTMPYRPRLALLPPANEVWGKVIFLHLFVILFTGGMPGPGGCLLRGGSAPGGSGPAGVSGPGGVSAPRGCLVPGGCLVETPPRMATAAGGMHPTGMHSCRYKWL